MDILVDLLFDRPQNWAIPGFFVHSTAPTNVEDDVPDQRDETKPSVQTIVDQLYENSRLHPQDTDVVIAIHGYNTGKVDADASDSMLESWYRPLGLYVNEDPFLRQYGNRSVFLGYRWPSETLKKKKIRLEALRALPVLLSRVLGIGLAVVILSFIAFAFVPAQWNLFFTILIAISIFATTIVVSLFLLRISVYFRDSYRAVQFGVPDLVELIRQLDQGLVERKMSETLTDDFVYERLTARIPETAAIDRSTLLQITATIHNELDKRPDLLIDPDDVHFQRFLHKLQQSIPAALSDEALTNLVVRLVTMQGAAYSEAQEYWRRNPIKLSFIGHSMGAHVTTQVIRILSDVFDPRSVGKLGASKVEKMPSSRVGRVFSLGRLVLVSPDIPLLTITSGRSNFLRSSLRRFEEAYLFSNEGDLALRLASTAANYFSFPARTRTQGYRLGNLTVRSRPEASHSRRTPASYGILNLNDLPNPSSHLLQYLEVSVLSKDRNQRLDPGSQLQEGEESVASKDTDEESIADLFTYFDCTEYCDRADYNPQAQMNEAYVMVLNRQKSPLSFWAYLRLFIAYATFSPKKFPQGGRDVHGGYFWGHFSKLAMYRLAFTGFGGLLESLITTPPEALGLDAPLPDPLKTDLSRCQAVVQAASAPFRNGFAVAPNVLSLEQMTMLQKRRQVALSYFSWLCQQRQIQVVVSPERYQVDVLGRDRDDIREAILMNQIVDGSAGQA